MDEQLLCQSAALWFVHDPIKVHRLEKELHGDNRCELLEQKGCFIWPVSLLEITRNDSLCHSRLQSSSPVPLTARPGAEFHKALKLSQDKLSVIP